MDGGLSLLQLNVVTHVLVAVAGTVTHNLATSGQFREQTNQ